MTPQKSSVLRQCLFCGKDFYTTPYAANHGNGKFCSISCCAKFNRPTHGLSKSRTYRSWNTMIQRCTNPKDPDFPEYGGAGITISLEWRYSFETFFADMTERPAGKSLDRLDGKLGYCKENCRWATSREQNQNRKDNRLLTFGEETKCLEEWARTVSLPAPTVENRLRRGWTIEETLTIPGTNRFRIEAIRKKRLAELLS